MRISIQLFTWLVSAMVMIMCYALPVSQSHLVKRGADNTKVIPEVMALYHAQKLDPKFLPYINNPDAQSDKALVDTFKALTTDAAVAKFFKDHPRFLGLKFHTYVDKDGKTVTKSRFTAPSIHSKFEGLADDKQPKDGGWTEIFSMGSKTKPNNIPKAVEDRFKQKDPKNDGILSQDDSNNIEAIGRYYTTARSNRETELSEWKSSYEALVVEGEVKDKLKSLIDQHQSVANAIKNGEERTHGHIIRYKERVERKVEDTLRSEDSQALWFSVAGDMAQSDSEFLSAAQDLTGNSDLTLDSPDGWDNIASSLESLFADAVGTVNPSKAARVFRLWKTSIRNRIGVLAKIPREQRTESQTSELSRRMSEFNSALDTYSSQSGIQPSADIDESDSRFDGTSHNVDPLDESIVSSIKSNHQIKTESELESLSQFRDVGLQGVLPDEGLDGLAVSVDENGNVENKIDLESLFDDDLRGTTYDGSWTNVGNEVSRFIRNNLKKPLTRSQYIGLRRGLQHLVASINRTPGQGGALRDAHNKIETELDKVDTASLTNDLVDSVDKQDFEDGIFSRRLASSTSAATPALKEMAATDASTSSWSSESADLSARILGDSNDIISTSDGISLSRSWKIVVRGIRNDLRKSGRTQTPPRGPVQAAALKIKNKYDKLADSLRGTSETDRANDLGKIEFTVSIFVDYNDIATEALENGVADFNDPNSGVTTTMVNIELDEDISDMADSVRIIHEIDSLRSINRISVSVLPAGGIDDGQIGSGKQYKGLGRIFRNLLAKEIAQEAQNIQDAIDAWNFAVDTVKGAIDGITGFVTDAKANSVRYATKKALKSLKKNLNLRKLVQKSKPPGDRDDSKALELDIHTENFKDLSGKHSSISVRLREGNARPTQGQDLNSEDLRSSNTIVSVKLVNALSDLKSMDPKILPSVDPSTSDIEGSIADPSSLYDGSNSIGEVMNNIESSIARTLTSKGKTLSKTLKVSIVKGLNKLSDATKQASKDVASSVGITSQGDLEDSISTAEYMDNTYSGLSASVSENIDLSTVDMVSEGIHPAKSSSSIKGRISNLRSQSSRTRSSKNLNRRLNIKVVKASTKRAANGRAASSGSGNTKK
ncbi:hypothetical protein HDU86_007575 [Geranomyces michiganensis]|nr:hypothetical protein HDU86_007575 [Geranomyces michiganensis]